MKKIITLGEILIRYSTNVGETLDACLVLHAHYGGSEANVSVGLASLGHKTVMLSKLPKNPLGVGAIRHLNRYGVNTEHIKIGGERLGTYYLESGAGVRAGLVVYDRNHSSFSEMKEFNWSKEELFDEETIFHLSGITLALSRDVARETMQLIKEAKRLGAKISFDSNYRANLWSIEEARLVINEILPFVDYCSMGELDAIHLLEIKDTKASDKIERIHYFYDEMHRKFPNISVFYSTIRTVVSNNEHFLRGTFWKDSDLFVSKECHLTDIVDRVGGGDAYAAGILHGVLKNYEGQHIVDFGTGLAAIKHTVLGDVISCTEEEVNDFIASDSRKIKR